MGILSFVVEISDAGMAVPDQPTLHPGIDDVRSVDHPEAALTESEVRQKYIDDQVQGEIINLDEALIPSPSLIGPRIFHDRNGLVNCPETNLQKRLGAIEVHSEIHQMEINVKKTKIMPFNFTKKHDFVPSLFINGKELDVVYEAKLLGVIIRSDCKWSSNTKKNG